MTTSAIQAAQDELHRLRAELDRAREGMLQVLRDGPRPAAAVISEVAKDTSLEEATVQRAMYNLVNAGNVELTDDHELVLRQDLDA